MKRARYALACMVAVSVVAIACEMKPIPYLGVISVSFFDVAVAAAQGYDNPSRAAALKKLDSKGEEAVGASDWKANNYIGPVAYKVMSGSNIVTENKECGKKAIEEVARSDSQGQAASGGAGGYTWYGGFVYYGGGCVYGCGTVTVGDPEKAEQ